MNNSTHNARRRVEHLCAHLTSSGTSAGKPAPVLIATADLCDKHVAPTVACLPVAWQRFGRSTSFHGEVRTLKTFEDNALVRSALEQPGEGRVLVIDGGGSLRSALVGDQIAALAVHNGWVGLVVHGAIRDSAQISTLDIGVFALGTCPVKSTKHGFGTPGVTLSIGGQAVASGDYLYADGDGVLVAKKRLH